MDKNDLRQLIGNRDAIATNRGFYYQYLILMKQWLQNFVENNDVNIFTEVDEDIKLVGDEIVLTQVKCYTQGFSLNSKEVKQTIYNFFIHFLINKDVVPDISFVFHTNSSVKKNEKLLAKWITVQPVSSTAPDVFKACIRRVSNILESEVKRSKNARLSITKQSQQQKEKINAVFTELTAQLSDEIVSTFCSKLIWEFSSELPEQSIHRVSSEIQNLLSDSKFDGRPPSILMNALLTEIYYCSQNSDKSKRLLSGAKILNILQKTDEELKDFADKRLLAIFNASLNCLYDTINQIRLEQQRQDQEIAKLKQTNVSLSNIPKAITSLPFIDTYSVLGRDHAVNDIHLQLREKKNIVLTGLRGIGKNTVARLYIYKYSEQYDHIIWIDAAKGFEQGVLLNESLLFNLHLNFEGCNNSLQQLIKFYNCLERLTGNNIIVIGNYSDDTEKIDPLLNLEHWKIVLTSQVAATRIPSYKIDHLKHEDACQLYRRYDQESDDALLAIFFESIGYNTLVIELTAKTIKNSLDMRLTKFMALLAEQKLDDSELEIELNSVQNSKKLFSTLQSVFNLNGLSTNEKATLDFLALLPSETKISDLVAMCGDKFQKNNKVFFVNILNELRNKGWIERNEDVVKIHKIVQQMIIYNERKRLTPFAPYVIFISWLLARFQEGFRGNPNTSFRFLAYGESILNTIKEEFRDGIRQPLFALENEVLNVYRWVNPQADIIKRWESLIQRAKDHLDANDSLLGVIYNNYAMALTAHHSRYKEIETLLTFATGIFRLYESQSPHLLLNGLNNLSILYLQTNNFTAFRRIFIECERLRKKYEILFDRTFAAQVNAIGLANQKVGNYTDAIKSFELAVKLYSYNSENEANPLDLIMYLNNLAFSLFISGKIEEAILFQKRALSLCDKFDFKDSDIKSLTITALTSMYKASGNTREAEILKSRYA